MQFNEWLTQQNQRNDAVGQLTRQLVHDSTSPLWSNKPRIYHQYFEKRQTNPVIVAAFECAWSEWQKATTKKE